MDGRGDICVLFGFRCSRVQLRVCVIPRVTLFVPRHQLIVLVNENFSTIGLVPLREEAWRLRSGTFVSSVMRFRDPATLRNESGKSKIYPILDFVGTLETI